jgi:hypothetical protein
MYPALTQTGMNIMIIAEEATVSDWHILKAVIPCYFQLPNIVKFKTKQEQSQNPTPTMPAPIIYWFYK